MPVTFAPVPDDQEMKLMLDMEKEGIHHKKWHIYPGVYPAEVYYCTCRGYVTDVVF